MRTDSVARSVDLIGEMYMPIRPQDPGHDSPHGDGFRFEISGHGVDRFRIDRIAHSSSARAEVEPADIVGVITLTRGHASYRCEGRRVSIAARESVAFPGHTPLEVDHSGYALRFVAIPADRIAERAEAVSGIDGPRFRMRLGTPVSRADEARWRATVDYLDGELRRADTAFAEPLFRANALDLLMDVALATFPHNAPVDRGAESGWVRPDVVRRAVEFVDARVAEPISVHDIAAAAGVDVRVLRQAFARHHGLTPTAYLRRVRLVRAERELAGTVDPSDLRQTAAVVVRWGFTDPAAFARLYRSSFGIPSEHVPRA